MWRNCAQPEKLNEDGTNDWVTHKSMPKITTTTTPPTKRNIIVELTSWAVHVYLLFSLRMGVLMLALYGFLVLLAWTLTKVFECIVSCSSVHLHLSPPLFFALSFTHSLRWWFFFDVMCERLLTTKHTPTTPFATTMYINLLLLWLPIFICIHMNFSAVFRMCQMNLVIRYDHFAGPPRLIDWIG